MNVTDATIDQNVKKVIALSTDKASSPINLYGATKLASTSYLLLKCQCRRTWHAIFCCKDEVMGSRGSVTITSSEKRYRRVTYNRFKTTRFLITLPEAETVIHALEEMIG